MFLQTKFQTIIQTLQARWHQHQLAQERQQMIARAHARREAWIQNTADRLMALPEAERERLLQLAERMADLQDSKP